MALNEDEGDRFGNIRSIMPDRFTRLADKYRAIMAACQSVSIKFP